MIERINRAVNSVVWGVPMLLLIVGTGILLTVLTRFFQVRHFGHVMRETFFAIFRRRSVRRTEDGKSISQFQAIATALAGTIGTGNIAGVASAIAIGGPGAVFWMWVSAVFGMMTNYAEKVLGIYYRKRNADGEWSGGAMHYIEEGLRGKRGIGRYARGLAVLFSAFCILASFGIGNMTQVNTISEAMHANFALPNWATGLAVSAIAGLIILGGIQRIARVTEKLVPFMALFYIVATMAVFLRNARQIPYVFESIFSSAFSFAAIGGGVGGVVIRRAVTMGFKRGVFSNEAGLGSSVFVHSASDVKEPAVQGMWAIFEVFFDTIIICTLTAFVLLSSTAETAGSLTRVNITSAPQYVSLAEGDAGVYPLIDAGYNQAYLPADGAGVPVHVIVEGKERMFLRKEADGEDDFIHTNIMRVSGVDADGDGEIDAVMVEQVGGVSLVTYAFSRHFGDAAGKILSVAVLLFAFASVLGWSFYGVRSTEYLLGKRGVTAYKIVFIAFIFLGALMSRNLAWDIADTLNGLMAVPNLIALILLSGLVVRITNNYIGRQITRKTPNVRPILSAYADIQREQEKGLE